MTSKRKLRRRVLSLEAQLLDALMTRQPVEAATPFTVPGLTWAAGTGTVTVRCTCPPNRGDSYAGSCPIHDMSTFS